MVELRFARLRGDGPLPSPAHPHDAGLDLRAADAFELPPGARALVGTGLAVELPEGTAGLVVPRSGLALRHGVTVLNGPGLVDAGYRGELKVLLVNTDATETFRAEAGERIAQLVVVPYVVTAPVLVEELGASARGAGGFGSTGTA